MKIIVTGANGMLGGAVCKFFSNYFKVYPLHKNKFCNLKDMESFSVNLLDRKKLKYVFDKIDPNLVIHCASYTNVDECEKVPDQAFKNNATTSYNLSLLCKDKVKIIYISTDQVYGNSFPRTELNRALNPINKYGESKLSGEKSIEENCKNHIVIRTNIFGWNINTKKVSSAEWIYQSLKNKKEIMLYNNYYFSPIFTEDLCKIIRKLIYINFNGLINIGSIDFCSKYDFGIYLSDLFGFNNTLIKEARMQNNKFFAKRPSDLRLDISYALSKEIPLTKWKNSLQNFHRSKL